LHKEARVGSIETRTPKVKAKQTAATVSIYEEECRNRTTAFKRIRQLPEKAEISLSPQSPRINHCSLPKEETLSAQAITILIYSNVRSKVGFSSTDGPPNQTTVPSLITILFSFISKPQPQQQSDEY
jgi:hypothetical protein